MKILSIELERFRPMMHGGITYFKGDVASLLTTILAQNGVGKSSLLRELSPYPAARPDYDTDGKKVITVSHEHSHYVLTSDFSNRQKAHSFVRDGVEENLSGATETQKDLVEHYFGLSQVIWDLMNQKYRISRMKPQERKSLLMTIHPSNLLFLQDHHKNVLSQLRAFTANIKLMQERHVAIKSKLLNEQHIAKHRQTKLDLEQYNILLDQVLFCIDQNSQMYYDSEDYSRYTGIKDIDPNAVAASFASLLRKAQYIKVAYPELHHVGNDIESVMKEYTSYIAQAQLLMETHEQHATYLKSELDQFQSLWGSQSEESLEELIARAEYLKAKRDSLTTSPEIPVVDTITLQTLENEDHPMLNEWILTFKTMGVDAWPDEKIRDQQAKISESTLKLHSLGMMLGELTERLDQIANRRLQESKYSYPSACVAQCEMKQALINLLAHTDAEVQDLQNKQKRTVEEYDREMLVKTSLEKDLVGPLSGVPVIKKIEDLILKQAYENYLLGNKPLHSVLNENPHSILYRTIQLINNSKTFHERSEVEKDYLILSAKINALEKAHIPSKEVLMKTLQEKQSKHADTLEKIDSVDRSLRTKQAQYTHLLEFRDLLQKVTTASDNFTKYYKYKCIEQHLAFNKMLRGEYVQQKTWIQEQLRAIDITLKEQDGLLTRLNDEVLPTLAMLTKKRETWSIVASALSPTDGGIPHVFLVRFINAIVAIANQYIKTVWAYDMSIDLLSEEKSLDFDFAFTIYKHAHINDIGKASDGQKAIIDLALNLAIIQYRQYGLQYPIKYDEVDSALSEHHRAKLIDLINTISRKGIVHQIFLVNQYASLYSGFTDNKFWVIHSEGILLPQTYNEHVEIR